MELVKRSRVEEGIMALLETNRKSSQYGLVLSKKDVLEIVQNRERVLKSTGRIELSFQVVQNFIESFCSSGFLTQENYVETLNELLDIFYTLKNDTGDEIADDVLMASLKEAFENQCGGSIELLSGMETDRILRESHEKISRAFYEKEEERWL